MQRLFGATAVLLVLTSGTALAGGPYLGFHGGSAGVDVELGDSQARLQSTDFAWKGFGGVGLGRFLAIETGYVAFGTAKDTVGGVPLEQKLWGWDTAGLVKINIGPVDLYGRVGGIYWKAEASFGSPSVSTDGFDVNYGGGVGVVLGKL
jgi:Outer membrane protein beta-barrel domain